MVFGAGLVWIAALSAAGGALVAALGSQRRRPRLVRFGAGALAFTALAGRAQAVAGMVVAAFLAIVAALADPFRRLSIPALDGGGLTPILEHPAMLWHPLLVYGGLALLLVPFAVTVARRSWPDAEQGSERALDLLVRRGLVWSWLLLTVGMVAGSNWSYVELGWGGYWAWDPVETASLLPWLAVTAARHADLWVGSSGRPSTVAGSTSRKAPGDSRRPGRSGRTRPVRRPSRPRTGRCGPGPGATPRSRARSRPRPAR